MSISTGQCNGEHGADQFVHGVEVVNEIPAFDPRISMVEHAKSTACENVNLSAVIRAIREGKYRHKIDAVRKAYQAGGKEAAKPYKERLPGFMASGEFSRRGAEYLRTHSGMVVVDIDEVGPGLETLREKLIADPRTLFAFTSPTGSGLKVGFRCDQSRPHIESYRAAERFMLDRYGVTVDESGKDVARLCFVSYDPDVYECGNAVLLEYTAADKAEIPGTTNKNPANWPTPAPGQIEAWLSFIPPNPKYPVWLNICSAVWSVTSREAGSKLLQKWSPEKPPKSYEEKWHDRLTRVGIGTLVHYAKENGWEPAIPNTHGAADDSVAAGHSNKSVIILPGGSVSITGAAEQIFGLIARTQNLFFRGGRVHQVIAYPDGSQLDLVEPTQFRSIVETYGKVFAWRAGANGEQVLKPTVCPEETAAALLAANAARKLLPNISALSACPVLAKDGDKISLLGPGWHPLSGGLFVTGGTTPPIVPPAEAVQTLTTMLDDFDFASPGDRSRAIASLIAPALRFGCWLSNPLPVDIGEADASQSGKTYRQKVVAAIYRESPNVVVQRTGGVGSIDESISQKLVDGRPFILLDNLRGKLDTQFLESILTAPGAMPARIPHKGEVRVDARSFVFLISSNGVETTRDLANRASLIRIRKRVSGYIFHTYSEGDLYAHVVANQPYYLGCVFSIVREWAAKGQIRTAETRHDFREWAQALDWIVQNLFAAAPLLDGYVEARERVSDPRRGWLRALCIALRDARLTGEFIASQLAEFALLNDIPPPNAGKNPDEATAARRIGIVMAAVFGNGDEIEVDGYKIVRVSRYNCTAEKEIFHYTFGGDTGSGKATTANPR